MHTTRQTELSKYISGAVKRRILADVRFTDREGALDDYLLLF